MAIVFFSRNGNSAASLSLFRADVLNGVIFPKRPVINAKKCCRRAVQVRLRGPLGQRGFAMLRLLRFLFVLAVLIGAAVIGYAYLGDLSPDQSEVSQPVTLDGS